MEKYTPIVRKAEIEYLKPAVSDISVDAFLSEEKAEEKIAAVNERGRGDLFLDLIVTDKDGNECAKFKVNLYCMAMKQ